MALDFDPRFTIEDPNGNTFDLFLADDTGKDVTNEINRTQVPYRQPEDNINFAMGQEESVSISGTATVDIANQSDVYSDGDPGLAEWVQDIFSITGAQGRSHTITDNLNDETFQGYIKRFNFQQGYPNDEDINWDMQLVRGQGLIPYNKTSPKVSNISGVAKLDGHELGSPTSLSMSKDVETKTTVIPDPTGDKGAEQNFISENGVTYQFDFSFKSRRNQLLDDIREMRELDASYTLETPFPGASYEVQVQDLSLNRDTENPAEWDLTLIQ